MKCARFLLPFFCCLFLFLPHPLLLGKDKSKSKRQPKYKLSIATIFCNEGPYLKEWIEYHKLIGVEHFYLYNNCSNDNYLEVLKPYLDSKEVDLIDWSNAPETLGEWDQLQVSAYRDALKRFGYTTKWLAIIDSDEFIVPCKGNNLVSLLEKKNKFALGGVCLIWSFFGTSNVEKIPTDNLLIETLTQHSGPANGGNLNDIWNSGAYKSIVKPNCVKHIGSPHYCSYKNGKNHRMLSYDVVHINHYWTRDEHYLKNFKIPRRMKWGQCEQSVREWANGMNQTESNNSILRFIPQLKKRMGLH